MATDASTIATAIFIISLFFCSTLSSACIPCGQSPPPKPKSCPPPPKLKSPPPPAPKPKSPPPPTPKPKPPPAPKTKSPPPPTPKPKSPPPPAPKPKPPPPAPIIPPPVNPPPMTPPPVVPPPVTPPPVAPPPVTPPPVTPPPIAPSPATLTCPKDTLKLGACADLLGGIVGIVVGTPVSSKCCALLTGLADLEAAVCLCTAIKANVLGINLNVPVTLSLIISACEKNVPPGFKCE